MEATRRYMRAFAVVALTAVMTAIPAGIVGFVLGIRFSENALAESLAFASWQNLLNAWTVLRRMPSEDDPALKSMARMLHFQIDSAIVSWSEDDITLLTKRDPNFLPLLKRVRGYRDKAGYHASDPRVERLVVRRLGEAGDAVESGGPGLP